MNGSGAIELFHKMLEDRETKRKELGAQLEELEREIQSIKHTYQLWKKEHGIPELPPAPLFEHGLSLTKRRQQALIRWAQGNKGILIPKEAKKALIAAGLIKPGKGAGWIVYGTITNMECWEKLEPGKYRLVSPEQPELDYWRCPDGKLHQWQYIRQANGSGQYLCENCPLQTDKATLKAKTDGGPPVTVKVPSSFGAISTFTLERP